MTGFNLKLTASGHLQARGDERRYPSRRGQNSIDFAAASHPETGKQGLHRLRTMCQRV